MTTTGSHYTVLARRFRPQAFDEVVGQEHVARALRNAIRAGRVAHAYMFTGARGVGKTSTARILAKALNCPNVVDGVPCNECEICQGISAGNDVDVLEIDGASNRGIDDIRSLRANVGVRSMRTQFKVYIIDEVHMLTREAFNALLKTLEEPPPNVKFVFCTTEPNKVPDTILSRCQRFDFSSIAETSIADRLRQIAKIEGFEVAEDALELVSRRARGSMRDSQSLFDQLLAFSDGTVAADDVHRMLGTAGDDRLLELFTAVVEHRPGEVLSILDACFTAGVQPGELMDQAIGYVRDLMITLSGGNNVALCSIAARYRSDLLTQARKLGMQTVMAAFQILSDAKTQMFRSTFARTVLEMAIVQLSLLENLTAISDLLSGRLPSPASNPTEPAAPDTTGEKKKSELSQLIDSSDTAASIPTTTTTTAPADADASILQSAEGAATTVAPVTPQPEFQLTPESAPLLLTKLVAACGRTIGSRLRLVHQLLLPSPSRIELILDDTADLARRVLDLPENRSQIEQEIFKLTGSTVTIAVRTIRIEQTPALPSTPQAAAATTETLPPTTEKTRSNTPGKSSAAPAPAPAADASPSAPARKTRPAPDPPATNLLGDIDPTRDNFVQHIVGVFNATVVKVTHAPASRLEENASQDPVTV